MDLESHLRNECTVSGILYLVLHMARVAGVAPVKFERVRTAGGGAGAWRVALSRFSYAYSCLVLIVLVIFYAIFVGDERVDVADGYEPSSNSAFMRVAMAELFALCVATAASFAATAARRTRLLLRCTAHLGQINAELDRLSRRSPSPSGESGMYTIVVLSVLYGYFTVCFFYGLYLRDVITANHRVPLVSWSFAAVLLYVLHLQQYSILFFLVVMRLVTTQQRLNISLKVLLQQIHNDRKTSLKEMKIYSYQPIPNHSITHVIDVLPAIVRGGLITDPETLGQLINIYGSLCGLIQQLGETNALALLALLFYMLAYLVIAPYFVVAIIFRAHTEVPILKSLSVLAWCVLCFSLVVLIAEPCHRSHVELFLTKGLVCQMIRCARKEALAVNYELKMFHRHILLNPVSFAPLGLVTLDRTLLVTMLSTTVTYLSVVIRL